MIYASIYIYIYKKPTSMGAIIMNKTKLIITILTFGILASCSSDVASDQEVINTDDNLVFALPFAPVSYPVFKMLEDSVFNYTGKSTELILWSTPDQLKALIVGEKADFFASASNTAATFYNKGIDLQLINISVWRLIWMVSRDNDKKSLADFKGEDIAMPFRGDMPHLVFSELAKAQGMDPDKDFNLVFEPHPMDAAQKMIMRRIDHAVLVDPAVSMVLTKTKSGAIGIVAPDLYRSLDFQDEWARAFDTKNEIPFAGLIAGATILNDSTLISNFSKEYKKAAVWCANHPDETARLAAKYVPQLKEAAIAEAMRNVLLKAVDANEARTDLENFYKVLMNSDPSIVGGKLPDSAFYYRAN
jgi:NitT/TauT family transport system substrate-binding protein